MNLLSGSDPILDLAAAAAWEQERFGDDEAKAWCAMQQAGRAVAREIRRDLRVVGVTAERPGALLILVGKGHNGGDALLAATELLCTTAWSIEVGFVFGQNRLRPLAMAAWRTLQQTGPRERVSVVRLEAITGRTYHAVVDGIFGFQFRPPLPEKALRWIAAAVAATTRLRAAVDLPSGGDASGGFVADVTYATGSVKSPVLEGANAGRLRYLDLGFFPEGAPGNQRVLTPAVLDPLRALRPAHCDKRNFGQLVVVGGSGMFPGAVGLSVAAALLCGVGNVTAFVPVSQAAAFAARWPEVMWVGCPETEDGSIAMDAGLTIRRHWVRATAALIGPGLGREPETLALVGELIRDCQVPLVLDADALQPDLINRGSAPRVLTPHEGEYDRLEGAVGINRVAAPTVLVRKGPITRITDGEVTYHGIEGGPVLARGGSGDILAGLIAGRLAVEPADLTRAAAQGVFWHGRAARRLAERWGEVGVRNLALLDELNPVLREETDA